MKLRSKRTQRDSFLECKIVLRVQTERADRLGALDLKKVEETAVLLSPAASCKRRGETVCVRNNEVHGEKTK